MSAAATALAPERLLAWLTAYEQRLAALAAAIGERECRRLGVAMTPAARRAWQASRAAWLGAPAPLSAFAACANRLALLDAAALRRVLAARALYASRGLLRRVVNGAQRRQLAEAVGEQAFGALLGLGAQAPAGAALPARIDGDMLAASGHGLIAADGGWSLAPAARLVLLTLDAAPPGRPLATLAPPPPAAPGDTTPFLASARLIFPEYLWLFG